MNNMQKSFKDKASELYARGKERVAGLRGGQTAAPAQPAQKPGGLNGDWSRQQKIDMTRGANRAAMSSTPNLPSTQVVSGPERALGKARSFLNGKLVKAGGALAVASAIGDSAAEDSTARYAKRFGVSEPTGDGSAGDFLKFAGLRAGGFASDLGNALTFGAAGNLYRDKPDGLLQLGGETKAAPAAPPVQPSAAALATPAQAEDARVSQALLKEGVSEADQGDSRMSYSDANASSMRHDAGLGIRKDYKLGGTEQYDNGNADIFATSTRKDGRLNSFTGVGNGNRPNWEQRNPAEYQAGLARAEKDKASVASIAANYAAQGDNDNAYRMAAGDPEATAAVEAAFQERSLRQSALSGNREAALILAAQGKDAADVKVANIAATGAEKVGLAKARADMAKAQQDQKNSDREFGLKSGKQRRDEIDSDLEVALGGKKFDKDGNLNPAYAGFMQALNETFLSPEMEAARGGAPLTLEEIDSGTLQNFLREYSLASKTGATGLGKAANFISGNSFDPTADMMQNAAEPGTAEESFLWDTYKTRQGQTRRVGGLFGADLTADERRRAGFRGDK